MKVEAVAGAAAGPIAAASPAGLILLGIFVYCWTVTSTRRTRNTVSIIDALRRRTEDPPVNTPVSHGRVPRRRRRSS